MYRRGAGNRDDCGGNLMVIKKVGVLGCGLMGSGIAQVSAGAGYSTVVKEIADDFLKKGLSSIEKSLGKFVEKVTITPDKRAETLGRLKATTKFAASLGKVPIRTSDRSGFVVNRLLVPYLLDAIRALEEGVGSVEDIDKGMRLGCGYPMGPFTLLDFVGLETTYYIANIMFEEFREKRFAPPPLLKRLVLAGHHGKKTGRGFYDYSDPANPKPLY